ncbi:histone-lysine N-methyltransferase SETMAR [Nephila pilipes]|uniref:Histone-lysine N-methyltransferase SETMAR n=1 Tax=Nephila pilipes TaxID=299642 RepID=A0A8X6TRW3_NEPPI|nr:histone-lysine N-methyltransferase SETMAR [Nephila pilipes]
MSRQQVAKWCRSFQACKVHEENRNMEASGRPSSSRTDINTARVEEIIQRDRRVTVREIASELDLSYGMNRNYETELFTDARLDGHGTILLLRVPTSRKTINAERKYSSLELDILTITKAIKKFQTCLLLVQF